MNLKLSKGVTMDKLKGVYSLKHYETVIFKYDEDFKASWALMNCSRTSNDQIKRALEWFSPSSQKVEYSEKKYGGSRN
jgi:hypothetical protein